MKNLNGAPLRPETPKKSIINKKHLLKYVVMFVVVTLSTLIIPTCGVLKSQAVFVGLLASSTLAILDMVYPNKVLINEFHAHSH